MTRRRWLIWLALLVILALFAFFASVIFGTLNNRAAAGTNPATPRLAQITAANRSFARPALPAQSFGLTGGESDSEPADQTASPAARTPQSPNAQHRSTAHGSGVAVIGSTAPPEPTTSVWDRLAYCESRNRWHINTGNTYYGGIQENLVFWTTYGGLTFASRPDLATRAQQILIATRARDGYTSPSGHRYPPRGYTPWPACSKALGLS